MVELASGARSFLRLHSLNGRLGFVLRPPPPPLTFFPRRRLDDGQDDVDANSDHGVAIWMREIDTTREKTHSFRGLREERDEWRRWRCHSRASNLFYPLPIFKTGREEKESCALGRLSTQYREKVLEKIQYFPPSRWEWKLWVGVLPSLFRDDTLFFEMVAYQNIFFYY